MNLQAVPDPTRVKHLSRRVIRRILPLAGFLGLVAFFDRVSIAYAGPQGMNEALGLTATTFGWAVGLFTVGYVIFEVPTSGLLAKFGTRRWLVRILITWGIIQCLIAFVPNAEWLYVGRFLLGVAEAGFTPAIYYYLSKWLVRAYRPIALIGYLAIVTTTGVVGPIIATTIIQAGNNLGDVFPGWRVLLLVLGLLAIFAAIPAHLGIKETIAEATWFSEDEKAEYQAILDADQVGANVPHRSFLATVRDFRPWLLGLGFFCFAYALFTITIWTPTIVLGFREQFDTTFNVYQSALIAGIPTLVGLPIAIVLTLFAARTGKTGWILAIGAIMGAIGCLLTTVATEPAALVAALCLVSFAGSISVLFMTLVTRVLSGAGAFAAIAIVNSIASSSSLVSPVATGRLNDATGNINAGFYLTCGLLVLGAAIALIGQRLASRTEIAPATVAAAAGTDRTVPATP
jgi:MFS family permease